MLRRWVQVGDMYRNYVMRFLSLVGYATTRQIAKDVWGRCDISSRKMAGRTLRWLSDKRLIVSKRDGQGVNKVNNELMFALTVLGAEEARRHGSPLVADKVHARDYLRHSHGHRTACNSVYVAWPTTADIWSELQVRNGDSPIKEFPYFVDGVSTIKIPDLIASTGDGRFEWIEVENSWRSDKDLSKVVDCMRAMFKSDSKIACMHFVVTVAGARTIGARIKKKLTHGLDSGWAASVRALDARIIANHIKVSVLDPETLTLQSVD